MVISSRKSDFAWVKTKATQDWHFCGWVISQPHCKREPKKKQGCLKIILVQLPWCPSRALPQEEPWTPLNRLQAPEVDLTSPLPHPLMPKPPRKMGRYFGGNQVSIRMVVPGWVGWSTQFGVAEWRTYEVYWVNILCDSRSVWFVCPWFINCWWCGWYFWALKDNGQI